MKTSRSDRVFDTIVYSLLIIILIIIIYPLYFTVIASFSDPDATAMGETFLWFKGFNLDAYKNVFMNEQIWTGYFNSIIYASVGTVYALAITISCAYAMSRKKLKGKNILMGLFVFTMYFGGGLIPFYLVIAKLGMINSRASMIIPAGFSVFNMIVTRTFYQTSFPDELYEAAQIEGCSEIGIYTRIALPLSKAIIAVIGLFIAVGHWNSYFSALLFLSDNKKWPLQLVLRGILIMNQQLAMDLTWVTDMDQIQFLTKKTRMAETMKYSLIFISSAPMLIAYPFVQKHFVKGIMIGSLKG
jgi:putative aldouronate transport system permease protein